tara:strand:+ start:2740 stop:3501 length:762 start_codon:yes stop_codon:yes gene_type:complete
MTSSFEELSTQFNSLLTEYTNTYKDYIDAINSGDISFNIIPNTSFSGESTISTLNGSTIEDCQSSCSSAENCYGATFNNGTNACVLSSGSGNVVKTQNSTSIVQQVVAYSYKLQRINSRLTDINKQMMNISKSSFDKYTHHSGKNKEKDQQISHNYQILQRERNEIDRMISDHETLNSAYEDGNINVTSNYYRYVALLFLAILLSIFLLKSSIFSGQSGGGANLKYKIKFDVKTTVGILITFLIMGGNFYMKD